MNEIHENLLGFLLQCLLPSITAKNSGAAKKTAEVAQKKEQ